MTDWYHIIAKQKQEQIDAIYIAVEEKILQEMRDHEAQRAKRSDAALAKGETFNEPPTDPAAQHAVIMTSSPGLTQPPETPVRRATLDDK